MQNLLAHPTPSETCQWTTTLSFCWKENMINSQIFTWKKNHQHKKNHLWCFFVTTNSPGARTRTQDLVRLVCFFFSVLTSGQWLFMLYLSCCKKILNFWDDSKVCVVVLQCNLLVVHVPSPHQGASHCFYNQSDKVYIFSPTGLRVVPHGRIMRIVLRACGSSRRTMWSCYLFFSPSFSVRSLPLHWLPGLLKLSLLHLHIALPCLIGKYSYVGVRGDRSLGKE